MQGGDSGTIDSGFPWNANVYRVKGSDSWGLPYEDLGVGTGQGSGGVAWFEHHDLQGLGTDQEI